MKDYSKYIIKTGDFIKENKKPILWIGGAVIVAVIGVAIAKRASKGIESLFTDKSIKENPFTNLEVDQTQVTISDSVANAYANQLYGAMKNGGTQEDVIYQILQKLQNPNDFRKVYNAFGKKSYVGSFVGGSPTKLDSYIGNYDNFDLIEWFKNEVGYSNYPTYSLIKKTVNKAGLAF